jgi:sec-independent protein translocase protein TatB
MFGIAWSEYLIIGIVALVVVPPKDLPALMRNVGRWVGQMRRMAFDFQHQVSEALREAELDDLKKSMADLTNIDPMADIRTELENAAAPLTSLDHEIRAEMAGMEDHLSLSSGIDTVHAPMHADLSAPPPAAIEPVPAEFPAPPVEPADVDLSDLQPPAAEHAPVSMPPGAEQAPVPMPPVTTHEETKVMAQ